MEAVKALREEWEDALGATKDTWRKAKEELLATVMAKNVRDMV